MTRIAISCPGSCGELFQCVLGEHECLLSYNIDRRSFLTVADEKTSKEAQQLGQKIQQAQHLLAEGTSCSIVHYQTDLPIGKGYSSSTADIISCLYAMSLVEKKSLSAADLTGLAAKIEPSDSVAFATWTVIDPLTGYVLERTSWQPELYVYILEPVGTVNTTELERMPFSSTYPAAESERLLGMYRLACQEKNIVKLGEVATYSALLNDKRLPKPYLKELVALAEKYQLVGVNIAHSGTIIGLLLTKKQVNLLPDIEREILISPIANYYHERRLQKIVYEGVQQIGGKI